MFYIPQNTICLSLAIANPVSGTRFDNMGLDCSTYCYLTRREKKKISKNIRLNGSDGPAYEICSKAAVLFMLLIKVHMLSLMPGGCLKTLELCSCGSH